MAGRAHAVRISMAEREEGVIARRQIRRRPPRRRMACCASCWPTRCRVIGVRGAGVVRLVTGVAVRRCTGKDIIDMALVAGDIDMGPGERERRVVVIECRPCPRCRGMACRAGCRKAGRGMSGIGGAVVIRLVAADTGSRQGRIVAVRVALRALQTGVGTGEWERRVVVIERGWAPTRSRMADRTIRRETRCHVVRIRSARKVRLVARIAGRRGCREVVIGVALGALQRGMRPGQGIVGIQRVIKTCDAPVRRAMACVTSGWEADRNVIRVGGARKVRLMASVAVGRQRSVVVVRMALRALQVGVSSHQREHRCMVKG